MSPHFSEDSICRPMPVDHGIWREIVHDNAYRLPQTFLPADTVIDIGAHIGIFSIDAWSRGSRHILSFEPELRNFARLCANTETCPGIYPVFVAVSWCSRLAYLALATEQAEETNTGGHSIAWVDDRPNPTTVPCFDLSSLIQFPVRFLKLDCEGSEYEILLSLQLDKLRACQYIALEYHDKQLRTDIVEPDVNLLVDHLTLAGFEVELNPVWKTAGYLYATRK